MDSVDGNRDRWNRCRFVVGSRAGHYESYFQRANHPDQPLAFWIRYTVFCPKDRPQDAVGELWAIYFDGQADCIKAAKNVVPVSDCRFADTGLDVRVGEATLDSAGLAGTAASNGHSLGWSLRYDGDEPPLLLFPERMYDRGLPKAKALVGTPNAVYRGSLDIDGERVDVDSWVGSQNHNWGSKHTDHYAWGQVAGFDDAPDAFLECSTARVKIGPLWTPWLTLMVARVDGKEYALNSVGRALRARGRFDYFTWRLESQSSDVRLAAEIEAPASAFVGLRYDNPPGGWKTCLNTKLAGCRLTVDQRGEKPRTLLAEHRAAFEILTDDRDHGIPIVA